MSTLATPARGCLAARPRVIRCRAVGAWRAACAVPALVADTGVNLLHRMCGGASGELRA